MRNGLSRKIYVGTSYKFKQARILSQCADASGEAHDEHDTSKHSNEQTYVQHQIVNCVQLERENKILITGILV